jgi:hypothetical protein
LFNLKEIIIMNDETKKKIAKVAKVAAKAAGAAVIAMLINKESDK